MEQPCYDYIKNFLCDEYDAEEIFDEEKMEVEVKEWPHHVQQNYGKYFDEDYDLPLVYSTKLALIYFSFGVYRPPDYFLDFFTVAKEMYNVNCYCDDTTDCLCECHWKGPNANWFSGLRDDWWYAFQGGGSEESKYYLLQLKDDERLYKSLVKGEVEAEAKKLCYYKDEFKVSNDDHEMKYRISLHVDEEINNYQQAYKEATDKYVKSEPIAGKKEKETRL